MLAHLTAGIDNRQRDAAGVVGARADGYQLKEIDELPHRRSWYIATNWLVGRAAVGEDAR